MIKRQAQAVTARSLFRECRSTIVVASLLTILFLLALVIPANKRVIGIDAYLPLHTTVELYAVTISLLVFALGWNISKEKPANIFLFIALGFLAVGLLDFAHALSYQGMPKFVTKASAQKAIDFWLIARISAALLLLALAISPEKLHFQAKRRAPYLLFTLTYVGIFYWIILYHPHWLPSTFIPGKGLTTFKVSVEASIVITHAVTAVILWRRNDVLPLNTGHWLACAAWLMGLSEMFFTQYTNVSDWLNLLGHVYKVIAYGIVYYALFVLNIKEPYKQLRQSSHDLQLSEARHAAVVSAAMDAIIMIDESQKIRLFNNAAEKMFGYQAVDVIGQPIDILIPEQFRAQHTAYIQQYASTGSTARQMGRYLQVSGVRRNGEVFPAEASISNASVNANQYLIASVRDLTEQRLAQKNIQLSEQRFQTLISNLHGVVYRYELSKPRHLSFISEGTLALTGYPADLFLGQTGLKQTDLTPADHLDWENIVHPEDRAALKQAITKAIASSHHYQVQYRIIHKNGSIRWVQGNGMVVREGDQPLYLDGFIEDITEQKNAEEQQLILKNAAIDHSNIAIGIASLEGTITFANTAFAEMWGYTNKTEVLGRKVVDFWQSREESESAMFAAQQNGHWSGRRHAKRKDGSEFIAETSASLVYDNQGKPTHMFATFINVTEQYRIQEQLRNSYQLLDAVFENTHIMIALMDPQFNFIRVNRAFTRIRNQEQAYFIGKNLLSLFPLANELEQLLRNVVHDAEPISYSATPYTFKDHPELGTTYWDWTLTPITDNNGAVTSLVLSVLDVTEQVKAIETLAKSKQELRTLNESLEERVRLRANELATFNQFTETILDTTGSLIVVLDKQGRIVRFNHACEQTTGYKSAEVLGRVFWEFLISTEELPAVKSVFEKLCSGHYPSTHENYWLTKEGDRRWISWTNSAMVDAQGNIDFVIGTGMDTTERRLAEIGLRQSEQQFRLLAENINEMFWLASPDRKIMYYVSPAFEKIWGRPCAEIYKNPMTFLASTPEEDRNQILAYHAEQKQGKFKDHYDVEFRIFRPNGELRWISSRYKPVLDENGKTYRMAGISVDITDLKLAEQQRLEQEHRHRDALIREVHHRIKNNLQGVMGLLRQHSNQQPALQSTISKAITQVGTMALVHGLQSKDSGERVILLELCKAIAANIRGTTEATISIEVIRLSEKRFLIAEDEAVPIALIMNELLFNAVKHSRATEHTNISLIIEPREDGVQISLRNPGTQLPKELNVMSGTGLGTGLSLVRTLLPKNAAVTLVVQHGYIETQIHLTTPAIKLLE